MEQQDHICGEIGLPTTIHLFRATEDSQYERIDSQLSRIELRTSCDLLRRCINDNGAFCRGCDATHAELFRGLKEDKLEEELKKRIEMERDGWDTKYENPYHDPSIEVWNKDGHRQVYLEYNCPMLGYKELMFPVLFEDNTIAILVVGQFKIEGEKDIILQSKRNFLEKNKAAFTDYCCKANVAFSDIEKAILESKREVNPAFPQIYEISPGMCIPVVKDEISIDEFYIIIGQVCKWLIGLQTTLRKEIRQKRIDFVHEETKKIMSEFHAVLSSLDLNAIDDIKRSVDTTCRKVANVCGLHTVAVFCADSLTNKDESNLSCGAFYASLNRKTTKSITKNHIFRPTKVRNISNGPTNSIKDRRLFNALLPSFEGAEDSILVYHPVRSIPAASVALVFQFQDRLMMPSIQEVLTEELLGFASILSMQLAAMFENQARIRLENTLRLYQHEFTNLSASLSRAIKGFLANPNLKTFDDHRIEAVAKDAEGTLNMFLFLAENVGMLIGKPEPPKFDNVPFYKDLLYKWEAVKRIDSNDKSCDFGFQKLNTIVWTDPRYAELVVYNLLTNAVKYAYERTKIYIHCEPHSVPGRSKFTVTNYAFPISEKERERIFDLGFRANYAKITDPVGNGIGLWIVKTTMRILRGSVDLNPPEIISDLNIPLLHAVINDPEQYGDWLPNDVTMARCQAEYKRLLSKEFLAGDGFKENGISLVKSHYHWSEPRRLKVQNELNKPTYEIRFEVIF